MDKVRQLTADVGSRHLHRSKEGGTYGGSTSTLACTVLPRTSVSGMYVCMYIHTYIEVGQAIYSTVIAVSSTEQALSLTVESSLNLNPTSPPPTYPTIKYPTASSQGCSDFELWEFVCLSVRPVRPVLGIVR